MTCELVKTLRLDLFAFVTGERAMDFALGRGSTEHRAVCVFEEELAHFHVFFVACRPMPKITPFRKSEYAVAILWNVS